MDQRTLKQYTLSYTYIHMSSLIYHTHARTIQCATSFFICIMTNAQLFYYKNKIPWHCITYSGK